MKQAWTSHASEAVARSYLAHLKIDPNRLELARLGENAVFRLTEERIVLRVGRPGSSVERARRSLRAAEHLSRLGVAVASPVRLSEDVAWERCPITCWVELHAVRPPTSDDVAELLSSLHRLGPYELDFLPRWNPEKKSTDRIEGLRGVIPEGQLENLERIQQELNSRFLVGRSELGMGVVHGDAHVGNVIVTDRGPIFVDLDELAIGPREIDLAPTLVARRRLTVTEEQWQSFSRLYGYNLTGSDLAQVLTELRELSMTAWLMQQWGLSREINDEIDLRLSSIHEEADWTRWHAF